MSKRELKPDLEYQKAFGQRVRKLREEIGWTQVDLAVHAGVSEYQISVIENGHQGPSFQTLRSISLALGKHPKDLFDFKYPLKLNTAFPRKDRAKPGVTKIVQELIQQSFFAQEREVSEVVTVISEKLRRTVTSSEVSAILLALSHRRKIRMNKRGGKNVYSV